MLYYIILFLISAAIFLYIAKKDSSWQNPACCLVLFSLLHFLSYYNVFINFLPSANLDANSFWKAASSSAAKNQTPTFHIGSQAYITMLYWQIKLTVNQLYVVQAFSIVFSALSVLLVLRIFKMIGGHSSSYWMVILLICLSPSFLLHLAITLREPIQLFSLLLFLNFALQAKSLSQLLLSASCLILAASTHQALLAYSAFILCVYCLISIYLDYKDKQSREREPPNTLAYIIGFGFLSIFFIRHAPILSGYTLADLTSTGIFEHLQAYRDPIEQSQANTAHNLSLSFDSFGSTAQSLVLNYAYYLFGPIINFKFSIEHYVLCWEALIRVLGISLMLTSMMNNKNRWTHICLSIFYLSITLLWSLGTTNDGQAFRHHVLSQWLLFIYIGLYIQNIFHSRSEKSTDNKNS